MPKFVKIINAKWIQNREGDVRLVTEAMPAVVCVHGVYLEDECDDCSYDSEVDQDADLAEEA